MSQPVIIALEEGKDQKKVFENLKTLGLTNATLLEVTGIVTGEAEPEIHLALSTAKGVASFEIGKTMEALE